MRSWWTGCRRAQPASRNTGAAASAVWKVRVTGRRPFSSGEESAAWPHRVGLPRPTIGLPNRTGHLYVRTHSACDKTDSRDWKVLPVPAVPEPCRPCARGHGYCSGECSIDRRARIRQAAVGRAVDDPSTRRARQVAAGPAGKCVTALRGPRHPFMGGLKSAGHGRILRPSRHVGAPGAGHAGRERTCEVPSGSV